MSAALLAHRIEPDERDEALAYLQRDARANLYLFDLTHRLGRRSPAGEVQPEVMGVWRGAELVGVAALRPSVVFDAAADPEIVDVLLPALERVGMGLVKSSPSAVEALWSHLSRRQRRRALLDRREVAYELRPGAPVPVGGSSDIAVRSASRRDLDALVVSARESLRSEGRPDPFLGDVKAFRRWVRGRVSRARVIETAGRIVFTGYSDVQRVEGWLIQGVYTWPDVRQRGLAKVGVAGMCREAFAAAADHVQLTVVEGNLAGHRLYESLGFEPFAELRTILFV